MAHFYIVVGTVMGTAQEVAEIFADEVSKLNHTAEINANFKVGDLTPVLENDAILIVCSSNTGMGDLPENIFGFYQHLTNDFPRIADKHFAQINLGDSSYPNFGQAGQTLADALSDIGAKPILPMLTFDASEGNNYNTDIRMWLKDLPINLSE